MRPPCIDCVIKHIATAAALQEMRGSCVDIAAHVLEALEEAPEDCRKKLVIAIGAQMSALNLFMQTISIIEARIRILGVEFIEGYSMHLHIIKGYLNSLEMREPDPQRIRELRLKLTINPPQASDTGVLIDITNELQYRAQRDNLEILQEAVSGIDLSTMLAVAVAHKDS